MESPERTGAEASPTLPETITDAPPSPSARRRITRWLARLPRAHQRRVWLIPAVCAFLAVGTATGHLPSTASHAARTAAMPKTCRRNPHARAAPPLAARASHPRILLATLESPWDWGFSLFSLVGLFASVGYAVHLLTGRRVALREAEGGIAFEATSVSRAACTGASMAVLVALAVCFELRPRLLFGWSACWFAASLATASQLWLARDRLPTLPARRAVLLVLCTLLTLVLGIWLVILRPEVVVFPRGAHGLAPGFSILVHALAFGIAALGASVIKATIRDMSAVAGDVASQWARVVRAENRWLSIRRARAGLPRADSARDAPPELVGLALSGGGIRAATVSLGFLQGLSRRRLLRRVDYLSSVSGGGWAAGAFAVAMAAQSYAPFPARGEGEEKQGSSSAPLPHEDSGGFWSALVEQFRSHGDYLVPGGIGVGTATLAPLVAVLFGGALNAFTFGFVILVIACLIHDTSANGWVVSLVLGVRGLHLIPDRFFVPYDSEKCMFLGTASFDLVTIFAALVLVAFALSLGVLFVAYVRGRAARTLRYVTATASIALLFGVTWMLWIALYDARTFVVAGSVVGITLGAGVAVPRLGAKHLFSMGSGLVAGHAALLQTSYSSFVDRVADGWAWFLAFVLSSPGRAQAYVQLHLGIPSRSVPLIEVAVASALAVGAAMFFSPNKTSPHSFWTRQIRRGFLGPKDDGPADWPLSAQRPRRAARSRDDRAARNGGGPFAGAPLHIVSSAVNIPGTADPLWRTRGTERFEMTPYYVGGPATGWAPTACYGANLSYADAIAISSAAVNAQGGDAVPRKVRAVLAALNLRLGVWLDNPRAEVKNRDRDRGRLWSLYGTFEIIGRNSEDDAVVLVSDGGHHENLGVEPLVARGCRVIVALDASADPHWHFADLARLTRLLRVPEGWQVTDLDVEPLQPAKPGGTWAERCVRSAVGKAWLRREGSAAIRLILVKSAVLASMPLEIREYAERHPTFPQQSTVDQFFDWTRFEAHRLLGERLADEIEAAEIETPAVVRREVSPL